jgi:hypothetical protein
MVKYKEKYGSILNKNSASKYTEMHLMMTQYGSKHVVIHINVNNFCYSTSIVVLKDTNILFCVINCPI